MSDRTAILYVSEDARTTIGLLRDEFRRVGISLENPDSHRILLLDEEGEETPTTETDLLERLHDQAVVRFQWWLARDQDIYCRVRHMAGIVSVDFALEGLAPPQWSIVMEILLKHCRAQARNCIGLVFDPHGVTEDRDWDSFFVRSEPLDWSHDASTFPFILAIPPRTFGRMKNVSPDVVSTIENDLMLLRTSPREVAER